MNNTFKVGTFNVLNLISPNTVFYGKRKYSQETYEKKILWIAGQLDKMQADIVGFQEIFDADALRDALQHSAYMRDAHLIVVPKNEGGKETPSVAIASRFPIVSHEVIADFPSKISLDADTILPIQSFTRPVLKAVIQVNETLQLTFLTAHLKSKRPVLNDADNEDKEISMIERATGEVRATIHRLGEALALRTIVLQELQGRTNPLILVGDLNDNDLAVSTQIISGEPPFKNMPFHVKKEIWDVLLHHVKAIQARKSYHDTYYSHIHNGHHEAIDHIMVSQELVSENPENIGRVTYVRVFNEHLIDETLSDERVMEWNSDHAQIVASFELR